MEKSNAFRQQVRYESKPAPVWCTCVSKATAKSWSPSSSLPVLREGVGFHESNSRFSEPVLDQQGVVELEAHADGVDCAVHEAWQESGCLRFGQDLRACLWK